ELRTIVLCPHLLLLPQSCTGNGRWFLLLLRVIGTRATPFAEIRCETLVQRPCSARTSRPLRLSARRHVQTQTTTVTRRVQMINKNRNLRGATIAAVATTMLGGASMATAAVPGFYMAGTIGQSSTDVGGEEQAFMDELVVATWESFGFNVLEGESDLDKSDIGFELAVGYQASPYFAVEAAYIDLGKAKYEAEGIVDNGGGPMDASSDLTSDAKGPALSLLGMLPVSDRFSLDARVGAMLGKSKVKFTASLQG